MMKIVLVLLGLAAMAMAMPNDAQERTFFPWAGSTVTNAAPPSFSNLFNLFNWNWAYTAPKPIGAAPPTATTAATTGASATTAPAATPAQATMQWVPLGSLLFGRG